MLHEEPSTVVKEEAGTASDVEAAWNEDTVDLFSLGSQSAVDIEAAKRKIEARRSIAAAVAPEEASPEAPTAVSRKAQQSALVSLHQALAAVRASAAKKPAGKKPAVSKTSLTPKPKAAKKLPEAVVDAKYAETQRELDEELHTSNEDYKELMHDFDEFEVKSHEIGMGDSLPAPVAPMAPAAGAPLVPPTVPTPLAAQAPPGAAPAVAAAPPGAQAPAVVATPPGAQAPPGARTVAATPPGAGAMPAVATKPAAAKPVAAKAAPSVAAKAHSAKSPAAKAHSAQPPSKLATAPAKKGGAKPLVDPVYAQAFAERAQMEQEAQMEARTIHTAQALATAPPKPKPKPAAWHGGHQNSTLKQHSHARATVSQHGAAKAPLAPSAKNPLTEDTTVPAAPHSAPLNEDPANAAAKATASADPTGVLSRVQANARAEVAATQKVVANALPNQQAAMRAAGPTAIKAAKPTPPLASHKDTAAPKHAAGSKPAAKAPAAKEAEDADSAEAAAKQAEAAAKLAQAAAAKARAAATAKKAKTQKAEEKKKVVKQVMAKQQGNAPATAKKQPQGTAHKVLLETKKPKKPSPSLSKLQAEETAAKEAVEHDVAKLGKLKHAMHRDVHTAHQEMGSDPAAALHLVHQAERLAKQVMAEANQVKLDHAIADAQQAKVANEQALEERLQAAPLEAAPTAMLLATDERSDSSSWPSADQLKGIVGTVVDKALHTPSAAAPAPEAAAVVGTPPQWVEQLQSTVSRAEHMTSSLLQAQKKADTPARPSTPAEGGATLRLLEQERTEALRKARSRQQRMQQLEARVQDLQQEKEEQTHELEARVERLQRQLRDKDSRVSKVQRQKAKLQQKAESLQHQKEKQVELLQQRSVKHLEQEARLEQKRSTAVQQYEDVLHKKMVEQQALIEQQRAHIRAQRAAIALGSTASAPAAQDTALLETLPAKAQQGKLVNKLEARIAELEKSARQRRRQRKQQRRLRLLQAVRARRHALEASHTKELASKRSEADQQQVLQTRQLQLRRQALLQQAERRQKAAAAQAQLEAARLQALGGVPGGYSGYGAAPVLAQQYAAPPQQQYAVSPQQEAEAEAILHPMQSQRPLSNTAQLLAQLQRSGQAPAKRPASQRDKEDSYFRAIQLSRAPKKRPAEEVFRGLEPPLDEEEEILLERLPETRETTPRAARPKAEQQRRSNKAAAAQVSKQEPEEAEEDDLVAEALSRASKKGPLELDPLPNNLDDYYADNQEYNLVLDRY